MKTAYKTFPPSAARPIPTTGITYTDQYDIFTVGAGYVDVEAALEQRRRGEGNGNVADRDI